MATTRKAEVHQLSNAWDQSKLFASMERVPRPALRRHKYHVEQEVQAILDTVEHGDAVKLKLINANDFRRAHMTLRHAIRKYGAGFHMIKDGQGYIKVWAEKVDRGRNHSAKTEKSVSFRS